jgi:predicted ATPase/DNA-binding SARP family transcriptional activator/DNA-binding CsgD family transcriptional regulator
LPYAPSCKKIGKESVCKPYPHDGYKGMCPPANSEVVTRPEGSTGKKPEAVRVWLLGGFRVSVGSSTIEERRWRLRKAAALVKLLALAPGHRLHREQAMDLLWPDSGRKAASNSLRKALHAARRTLDPAGGSLYLASQDESLMLCPGGDLWVDVDVLEEAAATARRSRDPAAYRAAIDFYAGDLLPEDRYEEWAEDKRGELQRLYLDLLVELAKAYEERDQYGPVVEVLGKAVAREPTNEAAHLGLMRVYALLGRRAEALAQFERLEEALSMHLGAGPGAETIRLRDELVDGTFSPDRSQPGAQPSGQPLGEARHNLPAPRDSFVGRERELREVKRELAMTRLLTLSGPGGSGKTRLALEVARDLVGAYPDAVWLVELAGLSEPRLVPQAVAGALSIEEQPDRALVDTIVDALRHKRALLVLDNCEHLIGGVARLVDALLDSCQGVRVLATSREALRVRGEAVWAVPTLSAPTSSTMSTVEELESYESARLFAERACRRHRSFALSTASADAVGRICRLVDGIPLAIELAAAWVGTASVEQIAGRLAGSLELLRGGDRTASPRQRTMEGTLNWSYELLSDGEKALFGRSAVFMGGWTLDAIAAVGSGIGVDEGDVAGLIFGLAEKSLIVVEAVGDGTVRYRLLEPVRQYALAQLDKNGGLEATRRRHAEYFLGVAEEAETRWWEAEEVEWMSLLEEDHDNLRAALSWSLEHGEAETALRLAGALPVFWGARGHGSEGVSWLERVLDVGGDAPPAARAAALLGLGDLLRRSGFERAQAHLEEALELYEKIGNGWRTAQTLCMLGWVTSYRGDTVRARTLLEKGLALLRESGDRKLLPAFLGTLAAVELDAGDFERALSLWEESLAIERKRGSPVGISANLANMGYAELVRGDPERATALFDESLALAKEAKDQELVAGSLMGLGIAATLRGDPERAQAPLRESLAMQLEMGRMIDLAEDLEGLAEAAGALGQHLRAMRLWGAAVALREDIGVPWRPFERRLHEPQLAAARSRLDEAPRETAFGEGKAMGLEEAVEYALSEEPSTLESPDSEQTSAGIRADTLTRREEEVAALVARGLTNCQIATELSISEHTSATHVRRILKKLGFQSRAQISSWLTQQRP